MSVLVNNVRTKRTLKCQVLPWWVMVVMVATLVVQVTSLNGPHVCMVKQKYNITKRVKYRAPMSVRTYEWCFSMPPRCSKWSTEMRDLTRLENEERTAEMAVCCPGYKMRDVSCVPICASGKTGHGCSEDCPPNKWGPNCVHHCKRCEQGSCSPVTGQCQCQEGRQGESCETNLPTTPAAMMEQLLTTAKTLSTTKTTLSTTPLSATKASSVETKLATRLTQITTSTESAAQSSKEVEDTTTMTSQKPIVATATDKPETFYNSTLTSHMTTLKPIREDVNEGIMTNASIFNKQSTFVEVSTVETTKVKAAETYQTAKSTLPDLWMTTVTAESNSVPNIPNRSTAPSIQTVTTSVQEAGTVLYEATRKTDTTPRQPTTIKFKPKEIWIRPTQKGESPLVDVKLKTSQEVPHLKHKNATKKEFVSENTTPKTIIVSIIPTSVSYATFKKFALTTASYSAQKNNVTVKSYNRSTGHSFTRPMAVQTSAMPITIKHINASPNISNDSTVHPILQKVTKIKPFASPSTTGTLKTTNSMSSTYEANKRLYSSNLLTTVPISSTRTTREYVTTKMSTPNQISTKVSPDKLTTKHSSINRQFVTIAQKNVTKPANKTLTRNPDTNANRDMTNVTTNSVTEDPTKDEETFHILTEPEHITAVMGDKTSDRSSVDLISVISIAGGVMMAIITVAVVIVMLERCRKPRYDDVRKYNDIRMQVMIDNDVPPPYVRSIFHTPLPEPPSSEKCHYQPISTLDRNLKQFMRPVVVQTISPLMLENFRGILECHYDHLPRRSHDLDHMNARCSMPPSMDECEKLLQRRAHSITDSTIDAMKCEARLDVIDSTTSEPLYAEIPCWRPPSEHAIEIVNVNGEAVTEL